MIRIAFHTTLALHEYQHTHSYKSSVATCIYIISVSYSNTISKIQENNFLCHSIKVMCFSWTTTERPVSEKKRNKETYKTKKLKNVQKRILMRAIISDWKGTTAVLLPPHQQKKTEECFTLLSHSLVLVGRTHKK